MLTKVLTTIVILSIFLVIGVAYFWLTTSKTKISQQKLELNQISNISPIAESKWLIYKDTLYHFSLTYPPDWHYQINDPHILNLAKYTVTFFSEDKSSVVDIWLKDGDWEQVVSDIQQDSAAQQATVAQLPAVILPAGKWGKVLYMKHPSFTDIIVVVTISQFKPNKVHSQTMNQIVNSLVFQ